MFKTNWSVSKTLLFILGWTIVVYCFAFNVDTMDVDASQYAEMSMGMMKSGDFLHLYDRGLDYLDKPPFLFWVSSLSMRLLGINNVAYKLPSLLFAIWALYATYRLASLLYNKRTGAMAAIVLASCQGMYLMTNDVRCDTILMSWVVTAIWMLAEWSAHKKPKYLLAGCVAIAFGMMTKGPIALMVPVFCFVAHWSLQREWRNFFNPWYLVGLVVIAVLLIPISIGFYQQFDLHPGKLINGVRIKSGLRFFYWSQSFGRITGESPWKNGADISFLMLNMLWSFLPWIFIFLTALVVNIQDIIRQKFRLQPGQEWISTGGFILSYVSLGSSSYQLPHYIFVAFPLAAIVTANFIYRITYEYSNPRLARFFSTFLFVLLLLLCTVVLIAIVWIFPANIFTILTLIIGIVSLVFLHFQTLGNDKKFRNFYRLIVVPGFAMLLINVFVTGYFYKPLLKYQGGNTVGRYLLHKKIDPGNVVIFKMNDGLLALHFYAREIVATTDSMQDFPNFNYALTMDDGLHKLDSAKVQYSIIYRNKLFKVSELTPEFVNPATRDGELKPYYLVKFLR